MHNKCNLLVGVIIVLVTPVSTVLGSIIIYDLAPGTAPGGTIHGFQMEFVGPVDANEDQVSFDLSSFVKSIVKFEITFSGNYVMDALTDAPGTDEPSFGLTGANDADDSVFSNVVTWEYGGADYLSTSEVSSLFIDVDMDFGGTKINVLTKPNDTFSGAIVKATFDDGETLEATLPSTRLKDGLGVVIIPEPSTFVLAMIAIFCCMIVWTSRAWYVRRKGILKPPPVIVAKSGKR